MSTLFRGATNGGANRVFLKNGDVQIAGQGVGGRQSLDADRIADVWGGSLVESATLKAGSSLNDINDAKISIVASGGNAFVLQQLADVMTGDGNINQVEKFGPKSIEVILSKFTGGLENAISRAGISSNDNGFEVTFGGSGVRGSVATNANFATREEAEEFLASLKAEVGQPDAYSVIVEDDDLDGHFQFEFEGWYRDVNANKIEGKLADSDVVSDGDIGSKAEGAAANLALFLEQMANGGDNFVLKELEKVDTGLGNLNQVENGVSSPASAEAIGSKFTGGVQNAVERASVRQEADGKWEIAFGGQGVRGAVTTNANFATEEKAQEFLDSLIDASGGFLDDALF